MHPRVLASLRCPVCAGPLSSAPGRLRCPRGHSFDAARQGYVDLSGGRVTHPGDTAAMVSAREALLSAGHLAVVTEAARAAVAEAVPGGYPESLIVEVGAGTGHHLARVLTARPDLVGLALDVSKPALRRAARAHPRLAAVRADVWRGLPVADGVAAAVLDVFAPRSAAEFRRVLRPGGVLIVLTPTGEHLAELVAPLGLLRVDPVKEARLASTLEPAFERVAERSWTAPLRLSHADVAALVRMGPSAWHVDPDVLADRLAALPAPVAATAAVVVSTWRPVSVRSQGQP